MSKQLEKAPVEIQEFVMQSHKDMLVRGIDEDGVLYIETYGECGSCPYNCLSEEGELSKDLKQRFERITRVSVTPAISEETLDFARQLLGIKKNDRD